MNLLTVEAFAGLIGSEISLRPEPDGSSVAALVEEAESLEPSPGAPRQDPFRVSFSVPPGTPSAQGSYLLTGGPFVDECIFLIPSGVGANGRLLLEATFN